MHLRGTLHADTALRLAEKNGVKLPPQFVSRRAYEWSDFSDFLLLYDRVGAAITKADDLADVASSYLSRCAGEGTLHVELMLSPGHLLERNIPYRDQIAAVVVGIENARHAHGISAGIILTCVRHRGPEEAVRVAELAGRDPHPLVVGFGMTGDERRYAPEAFRDAFAIASSLGLGLTAHAGEWLDCRSLLATVDLLRLDRVGHGIRAVEDPAVLAELAARGTGLEICLSSNAKLKAVQSLQAHPLPLMLEAGCRLCLSTDDPAYFDTSPANEYRLASTLPGIDDAELWRISLDAIEMSFCDDGRKAVMREAVGPGPSRARMK
ncbi:MAG: adenosine deaminase [Sphingomonadales bacterium]|nr:adenosine deaminase [Sphingomonadales bacterium]